MTGDRESPLLLLGIEVEGIHQKLQLFTKVSRCGVGAKGKDCSEPKFAGAAESFERYWGERHCLFTVFLVKRTIIRACVPDSLNRTTRTLSICVFAISSPRVFLGNPRLGIHSTDRGA